MSPNKLHLECSLDKELYYHGETISVNVHIQVNFPHFLYQDSVNSCDKYVIELLTFDHGQVILLLPNAYFEQIEENVKCRKKT